MTGQKLAHDTWVLVADGEKALFLRNEGDEDYPNLQVVRKVEHDIPPTREQGSDSPGRYADGGPNQRSSFAETDWHALEQHRFAKELSGLLYKMAHRHRFERLVIVAPPKVLGGLRGELHKEVSDKVVGEHAKTLTTVDVGTIEKIVAA